MINFIVNHLQAGNTPISIPEGIGLNLMEVLKAAEFQIQGTCGGMALCATCRVRVLSGGEKLSPPADAELDLLDSLPFADDATRLSCQLRVDEQMNNCIFELVEE
jgi:2Fe-2S ferredoxin